jgi:hypothetical protein
MNILWSLIGALLGLAILIFIVFPLFERYDVGTRFANWYDNYIDKFRKK